MPDAAPSDPPLAALAVELRQMAGAVRPTALAVERTLPVHESLGPLFPMGGLARSSTIGVSGPGATSLALAVAAGPSAAGSWVGFVGAERVGWAAAAELGVAAERTLVVCDVGVGQWPTVTAALIDAVDVVVASPTHPVRINDARRLAARARERGAVLVVVQPASSWPMAFDVGLEVTAAEWCGVGSGHGRLSARRVTVSSTGRRGAARPRDTTMWLPAATGEPACVTAGTERHLRAV